jgi:hypothetical protein
MWDNGCTLEQASVQNTVTLATALKTFLAYERFVAFASLFLGLAWALVGLILSPIATYVMHWPPFDLGRILQLSVGGVVVVFLLGTALNTLNFVVQVLASLLRNSGGRKSGDT